MRTFTLFIADAIFRNDLTPAIMDVEDLLANRGGTPIALAVILMLARRRL